MTSARRFVILELTEEREKWKDLLGADESAPKQAQTIERVVCANDAMAIGALDACVADLGLNVPGDVSVTGFDDIAEGGRPMRGLTTVRQPTQQMAALAVAETLRLCRTAGEQRGAQHMIAGTLMLRRSSTIERG